MFNLFYEIQQNQYNLWKVRLKVFVHPNYQAKKSRQNLIFQHFFFNFFRDFIRL